MNGVYERYKDPILPGRYFAGFGCDKRDAEVLGLVVKPFCKQWRLKEAGWTLLFQSRWPVGGEELVEPRGRQGLIERLRGRLQRNRLPGPLYRVVQNED